MKVFLEQSGYALSNLGDLAMLKVAADRIKSEWVDCEISVPTSAPRRLTREIPGTTPVRVGLSGVSVSGGADRFVSAAQSALRPGRPFYTKYGPHRLINGDMVSAFEEADCVISSGGGFVCDTFSKHGIRVLQLFREAQSRGVPTAMFGQGIGPVNGRRLGGLVAEVLPNLDGLGLRVPHADSLPRPEFWGMFADDALELSAHSVHDEYSDAVTLGVNFRVATYNGADLGELSEIGRQLGGWSNREGADFQWLPIDLAPGGDVEAIEMVLEANGELGPSRFKVPDSVESLASAARSCSAVVTMSYHAAVFALGAGVPTICLTRSSYYDAKFKGLQSIFGSEMCAIHTPSSLLGVSVDTAVARAISVDLDERERCRAEARRLVGESRVFYQRVLRDLEAKIVL